jgi:hypothetical protein
MVCGDTGLGPDLPGQLEPVHEGHVRIGHHTINGLSVERSSKSIWSASAPLPASMVSNPAELRYSAVATLTGRVVHYEDRTTRTGFDGIRPGRI